MQPDVFIFNDTVTPQILESFLKSSARVKWFHGEVSSISWFDTFESALQKHGFYLHQQKGILTLEQAKPGQSVYSVGYKKQPKKLSSIPVGGLNDALSPLLNGRALMPILSVDLNILSFNFVDIDGKILAQGRLFDIVDKTSLLILRTIRGYDAEVQAITKNIPSHLRATNIHEALFRLYKIRPSSYESKPVLNLSTFEGMAGALYEILHANFVVMRKNEDGIVKDIDIEFLHDFRIAGRRMRSALSLIKGVIKSEKAKTLKDSLKQLGAYTGPLRDLDVYLLKYDAYARLLPATWNQQELTRFFRGLKAARTRALTRLQKFLKSNEYQTIFDLWGAVFNTFDKHLKNDPPLRPKVSKLIHEQFERLLHDGSALDASSKDEAFHELRIDAKKLRYLLEFFQSLYARADVEAAIKQLKFLQDNLGAFNDLSVQIEFLENQINRKKMQGDMPAIKTLSAIIGALNYEKILLRQAYARLYVDFSSIKNKRIYTRLFKENPDEGDIVL